jgi:ATP-dependent helicase HepA
VGKLVRLTGGTAEVDFFDAPVAGGTSTIEVSSKTLRKVALERQTRIWWNEGGRWRIGRILEPPNENTDDYLVALPGKNNVELNQNQFCTRWSRPFRDPVRLLEARATDPRFLQRNRSAFVRQMLAHRAATEELVGISSSAIHLYQHQVSAARRVLLDPVRRYLLADEVGLGKTIEAGMVIRQTLLDESGSRIVILVPPPLVAQWEDELHSKFDIQDLNGGRVDVAPHDWPLERTVQDGGPIALLVIDEAHRLSQPGTNEAVYECVAQLAADTPSLLLLSATPVRTNEDGFLRLLHLLDPMTYKLTDLDMFRRRVEQRDNIGDAIALLVDDTPVFLLRDAMDELRSSFPEDQQLSRMLDELAKSIDTGDELRTKSEVQGLRHYVSDTYRIHRRLIRTRRNEELRREFPVRGRTRSAIWRLVDTDPRRHAIVEALDRFRGQLAAENSELSADTLRVVAARCSTATPAVRALKSALESGSDEDLLDFERPAVSLLHGHPLGRELAQALGDAIEPRSPDVLESGDARIDLMADWAWSKVDKCKVAACSSYTSVASVAFHRMAERFGHHRVAALLSDMSPGELESAYERAMTDDRCLLLVCDTIAEEGFNLQFVHEVLHLDLPWSANRLEQRLGRFDRCTVGPNSFTPVLSTIVGDAEPLDALTEPWTRLLDEGFELFTHSSATLQYALPERESAAVDRAIEVGFSAIAEGVELERDELAALRRHIEGQDLLDAVDEGEDDRRAWQQLLRVDRDSKALGKAISGWVGKGLNLSLSISQDTYRFGINSRNSPLLTESQIRRIGVENFGKEYVIERRKSGRAGVRLLRPGQPFLDHILDLSLRDDRGRSFSGTFGVASKPVDEPPQFAFFFDILISPMIRDARIPHNELVALERQALAHLSPIAESIWFVPGRGEPPSLLSDQLERSHLEDLATDIELFEELTDGLDWPATCRAAESEATARVLARPSVIDTFERAARSIDEQETRVLAQCAARAKALEEGRNVQEVKAQYELIREAVAKPHVRTDSCGVIVLLGTKP